MNQRDFYNKHIRPYLKTGHKLDRPYNRQLYNDTKDQAHRQGLITNWQAKNWVYPDTNAFLAPSEKRNNKRWSKRK